MADKIQRSELYGTPVFAVQSQEPEYGRVYGALRIPEKGTWVFPAFHPFVGFTAHDFECLDVENELSENAKTWLEEQRKIPELIEKQVWDPRFQFRTNPYDHQRDAFAYALYNLRAGLLLDMGLGKTKVAIDVIRHERLFHPVKTLVIVPSVILYKWADEVRFHAGGELTPVVIDGTPKKKKKLIDSEGDVYIATYGTVSQPAICDYLIEQLNYKILVVDESHNLQTHNSVKTDAVTLLSRKAPRRMIMSGTAALGDPRHLWGQLHVLAPFINPEKGFFQFCGKFVNYADDQRRIIIGFKNLDVLNKRLYQISIRKKKEDALDLPERTFVPIQYTLHSAQRKLYNELVTASLDELEVKLNIIEEATPAARLTKLLQILSGFLIRSNKNPRICDECDFMRHCVAEKIKPYTPACSVVPIAPASTVEELPENPKLDALKGLLDMALAEPTNKVVVWAKFLKELDDIGDALEKLGVPYVRVDGSLSAKEMRTNVSTFQNDPTCRVYIAQVATGIGIELTAANYMIFYSLTWNLGEYLQALDRAHRIGQLRNVTVYTLLYNGSVDEAVFGALQNKEDISAAITDPDYCGVSKFVKKITRPQELI